MKERNNFRELVFEALEKHKKKVAIIENRNDVFKKIKYNTLKKDIISFGTALNYRFKLNDSKIGVIGENSYKWLVTYLATVCGNNVIVPLDAKLPEKEIVNLVKRAEIKCLVYSNKLSKSINNIKNKLPKEIIYIKMNKINEENEYAFDEVLLSGKRMLNKGMKDYLNIKIDDDKFCSLLFTSGTTSKSKGVMLSHKNIMSNVSTMSKTYGEIVKSNRVLSFLPMHHTYEMTVTYLTVLNIGGEIGISRGIRHISEDMKILKPGIMCCVPLLLENIKKKIEKKIRLQKKETKVGIAKLFTNSLKKVNIDVRRNTYKDIHKNFGGKLKYLLVAGAPTDKEIINLMESFGFEILQGYGLTETSPLVAGTPIKNRVAGTVGKAIDGVEVRIDILPDEIEDSGEIMVKGPNVMLGYYKDKKATEEVVKKGWFYTGDIGYFDKKGNLVISGRSKNVIVTSNGKNIYPEELESIINRIKIIEESIVYGKERRKNELEVGVAVRLDKEYLKEKYCKNIPSNEELRETLWKEIKKINRTLPNYKAIKYLEIKEEEFVKTTTSKIKRKESIN